MLCGLTGGEKEAVSGVVRRGVVPASYTSRISAGK